MVETKLQARCIGTRCDYYKLNVKGAVFNCSLSGKIVQEEYTSCSNPERRGSTNHVPLERQTRGRYHPTREF